jgi:hypothetical protein
VEASGLGLALGFFFGPQTLNEAAVPFPAQGEKVIAELRTVWVQERVLEGPRLFFCLGQLVAPPAAFRV